MRGLDGIAEQTSVRLGLIMVLRLKLLAQRFHGRSNAILNRLQCLSERIDWVSDSCGRLRVHVATDARRRQLRANRVRDLAIDSVLALAFGHGRRYRHTAVVSHFHVHCRRIHAKILGHLLLDVLHLGLQVLRARRINLQHDLFDFLYVAANTR